MAQALQVTNTLKALVIRSCCFYARFKFPFLKSLVRDRVTPLAANKTDAALSCAAIYTFAGNMQTDRLVRE
jgi:hypothetical protein